MGPASWMPPPRSAIARSCGGYSTQSCPDVQLPSLHTCARSSLRGGSIRRLCCMKPGKKEPVLSERPLKGYESPWLTRLDHVICECPDIERAFDGLVGLGFPVAWPIGRFWPQGRTAGIALGGLNLELLQQDEGAPAIATIRTLVFEPVNLEMAVSKFESLSVPMRIAEKWESDPALLRLRGFSGQESQQPQLICRNAYPIGVQPFDFFLCEYSPGLKTRLAPKSQEVSQILLATPKPQVDFEALNRLFGRPTDGLEILLSETPHERCEVIEIRSSRSPMVLEQIVAM